MDLNSPVEKTGHIGPVYSRRLKRLNISTIRDLFYHLPARYQDFSQNLQIKSLKAGEIVTVRGTLIILKNQYTKTGRKIQAGTLRDSTGQISVIWFNQPYLVQALHPGIKLSLSGKVDWFAGKMALISPQYEIIKKNSNLIHTGKLVPIYPETAKLSSKWLRAKIKTAFDLFGKLFPKKTGDALKKVHFPKKLSEAESGRKWLAYEELLELQIRCLKRKKEREKTVSAGILKIKNKEVQKFISSLPFELTDSQKQAIAEIQSDLQKKYPMNRLLEGDVGSGKTVIAAIAAFITYLNNCQTVFMAPTQILAQQHYQTLKKFFANYKIKIALITSQKKQKKSVKYDIFVGTHALIHQKINFSNVSLVVIDEQHRFGVNEREYLAKKSGNLKNFPHVLMMTATPIPRSAALVFYGDLDISFLREIPGNRNKVTTYIVPSEKRLKAYAWLREKLRETSSQAFIVCPLIEESETETLKDVRAAESEYKNLKKIFPNQNLGLLHGRMKNSEKEKVLKKFQQKEIDILVSTPVVEVGLDIPNATIMVVNAAERFGLAQLHQLRGRVGRGQKRGYCLLFTESTGLKIESRLNALKKGLSGFELAELDLTLRGPGEIFGQRQHGLPDLKIASWQDTELIQKAKKEALRILS